MYVCMVKIILKYNKITLKYNNYKILGEYN